MLQGYNYLANHPIYRQLKFVKPTLINDFKTNMKQFKKLAMAIAGLWCCMAANAHDFEVDGIYYNILTTAKVEITFKGSSYYEYDNEYTGKAEIPESVTYNGNTYSVTSIGDRAFYGYTRNQSFFLKYGE